MSVEELKKQIRAVDLALAACRKRQSPRTGFVHLFAGEEPSQDTIPVYENFLFAFALFRQKTAESVLEGKELVERLVGFQTECGNFPTYLHDFPRCWDHSLPLKIAPIAVHLLRAFGSILGAELKELLEKALGKMIRFAVSRNQEQPYSSVWQARLQALQGKAPAISETASFSAHDWFEWIVASQTFSPERTEYPIPYNPHLQLFLGAGGSQEKGEPKPVPVEWALAEQEESFSPRLALDHPGQIACAALLPFKTSAPALEPVSWDGAARLFWGGSKLHSLSLKSAAKVTRSKNAIQVVFDLPEGVELGRELLFEAALFVDHSPETELFVCGKKGTVFRLGDPVRIQTPELQIECVFELLEGEGMFCGHLLRANRPGQVACKGPLLYETYDWQIGLRTLRRSQACKIQLTLKLL